MRYSFQAALPPTRLIQALAFCLGACLPGPSFAITLSFPPASTVTAQTAETMTSYAMPVGPWQAGSIPVQHTEGWMRQTVRKVPGNALSSLQLLEPLRTQLLKAGYRVLFECATVECGGFDFRFGIPVLPEPDMHVDLGDFRFLSADRGEDFLTLIVSRSSENGFVQITLISPQPSGDPVTEPLSLEGPDQPGDLQETITPVPATQTIPPNPGAAAPASLAERLESLGLAPLDDLAFAPGTSNLAPGSYASLTALAEYLNANPDRKVALVGHTDASGTLEANITLSRRRAASVLDKLLSLGVPRAQMTAQGVGYLSPRAANLTEAGRAANRRVEVVLTSTQ